MHSWLLWTAVGLTATLNAWGWPPIVSTLAGSNFCLCWILINVSSRQLVENFLGGCCDVFFRQIVVVGAHKLNRSKEPLLLAIAPHSNQFIDPMLITKTFQRPIGFLCAAKSMRYKGWSLADIVAYFARVLNAVPVERPQDLAKEGIGTIVVTEMSSSEVVTVHGTSTKFSEQAVVGGQILIASGPNKGAVARIKSIASDTSIQLSSGFETQDGGPFIFLDTTNPKQAQQKKSEESCYKLIPKLDHHDMYQSVYTRLADDGVVGIFPEGGSHDRATLLPFKAGIAVMALGACQQYGENLRRRLRIVAVGLNYFSGHQFRSRVFVDYGIPLEIPKELVEAYANGDRRNASQELMDKILAAAKAVTVQAPDHKTQEVLYMLRRLYVAEDFKLSLDQKVAVTRGLARAFEGDKDLKQVKDLIRRVADYNQKLKQYKIHDRRVALGGADETVVDQLDAVAILLLRVGLLFLYAIALVPGLLLASPLLIIATSISRAKARAAVAGSRVKLTGKDVLGTWKVLVGMVLIPVLHLIYTSIVYYSYEYKYAVAYFFFFPFISTISILASESAIDVARSIGAVYVLIFDRRAGVELRHIRRHLKADVRSVAHDLGWNEIITKTVSHGHISEAESEAFSRALCGDVSAAATIPLSYKHTRITEEEDDDKNQKVLSQYNAPNDKHKNGSY